MKTKKFGQHFLKLILCASLILGAWALYHKNLNHKIIVSGQTKINSNTMANKNLEERAPSSVSNPIQKPSSASPLAATTLNWNEKLSQNLHLILDESEYELVEIKSIKPVEIKKSNYTIAGEKVLITLKNKQGLESSFNAVVNTRTGQIIQTWNRTHFERKPNTLLQ